MIDQVLPYLEKGDIVIDGGNSLFTDTNRRTKDLAAKGILFVGTGVSGGEEGAPQWSFDHAGRQSRRVAAREGYLSGDRCQG
jgi:6-phosphogluconate dehydrogenase